MNFTELGISREWISPLAEQGVANPLPVQTESIPLILNGQNLIVQSPTGSGKTLAYLLPIIETLNRGSKSLEGIALLPSRELAVQVRQVASQIMGEKMTTASLIGGASITRQIDALKLKPKLATGTPGRVLELFDKGKLNGQEIRFLVVDEADKMFSQGFDKQVKKIFKKTLKTRQALFFSASVTQTTLDMAESCADDWIFLDLTEKSRIPAAIKHEYFTCNREQKAEFLQQIVTIYNPAKVMVFIQNNEGVSALTVLLKQLGLQAEGLHAFLPQADRKRLLNRFRSQTERDVLHTQILVTTDFLARGLDIQGLDLIINYDVPEDGLHYLHRAGRTGRVGKPGRVATLVLEAQKFVMAKFARELKIHIVPKALGDSQIYTLTYRGKTN